MAKHFDCVIVLANGHREESSFHGEDRAEVRAQADRFLGTADDRPAYEVDGALVEAVDVIFEFEL